ncbi:MAG TPA: LD-carboxypeptidase [Blastocatellia bacterium]|nr:LD-carboxypeptidase [Blastocatellia bacterium]
MERRNFITTLGAAIAIPAVSKLAAAAGSNSSVDSDLIRPPVLRPGDTVGLITPSTYVSDPDQLALVDRTIKYFGLKAKIGKNVAKRAGYLGGSIDERLDDLHAMFRDPEVRAIFAIRGGYGSAQLLDRIDYDLIRKNPKIFLGYSDITALHLAINRHAGLITFHGPVVLSRFTDYTQGYFKKALFETKPIGVVTNPPASNELRPNHSLRTVRPGRARGRLIGGNLTLISTTMGTPYEIETRGRILFIEDVGEEPYRIDRMLTQLRLAGKFKDVAGVIFGECSGCKPNDYQPGFNSTFTLGEIVDQFFGQMNVPVISGLTIGHTDDQITLPEGAMATLDADKGEIVIEETVTRD